VKTVTRYNILLRIRDNVRWFGGWKKGAHGDGLVGKNAVGGIEGREQEARDTAARRD
jgi:hypothetical protein